MEARPDDEYVEYVRARQGQFLRVAYLVGGDRHAAARVLDATFRRLARSWARVRAEDPDTFVRRKLYRDALAFGRHDPEAPLLLDLTQSQRAPAVLLLFEGRTEQEAAEVLGWTVHEVRDRARAALGRFRSADALADRFGLLADQVPEADFAESSWRGAVSDLQHRRRSTVAVLAALAVVGAGAGVIAGTDRTSRTEVTPAPTTAPASHQGRFLRTFSNVPYVVAPEVGDEPGLERLPSELPEVVALPGPAPARWDWPADRPLVAVLLTGLEASGRYAVALLGPDRAAAQVPGVSLEAGRGADGRAAVPLSATAVSPDGRTVAFPQPGRVVLLSVQTGRLRSATIPGARLQWAGWTRTGSALVAGTGTQSWLVDARTLQARPLTRAAPAGEYSIAGSGVPRPYLQTWGADGEYLSGMGLPVRPELDGRGDTVGNDAGWAGRAAALVPDVPSSIDGGHPGQGLVAVHAGDPDSVRLLLFGRSDARPPDCCRAVGWKGRVLLFTSRSQKGQVHVLGWDVQSGQVLRVARVPTAAIAFGPGF